MGSVTMMMGAPVEDLKDQLGDKFFQRKSDG